MPAKPIPAPPADHSSPQPPLSLVADGRSADERGAAGGGTTGGPPASDAHELEAFVALTRDLYVPLCRAALDVTKSHHMAEDVVQDVLATYWIRDRHRAVTSIRGYLYRAVRHRALRAIERDRRMRTESLDDATPIVDQQPHAEPGESIDALEQALAREVELLPKRCRLVYVLSREEGLSYAEIAEIMGISIKTVEVQLCKALSRLRIALTPYLP